MSLLEELRRRNVFRVAAAYLVVGWLLTEVLTTILPTLGAPEWTARAVILTFAFGFIPTVIFSWIFELTPEGIKRESEVDRDPSTTRRAGKTLDYVTMGAVVVLVVFFALFSARQAPEPSSDANTLISGAEDASVAVLPFINMSNDQDNEYFSDGLTETLLHMLTQIPDLKVAARTSSFSFKNQNKTVGEIATTLGVAHILEGSVQRFGDRVRITAQLIRAEDGFHIWSESYDRTLDDIFAIQDDIAERVGIALSASLLNSVPHTDFSGVATTSPDAYDLYLQALREGYTYSYGGLRAAEDLLKGALTIDPDFLDAKTALAYNYLGQVETGLMSDTDAYAQVEAITGQVLAEKPTDVATQAARMFANAKILTKRGDPEANFRAIEVISELTANEITDLRVRILMVRLLQAIQQHEKALDIMREAVENDPLNARVHYELGSIYGVLDRAKDARAALLTSLEIEPAQPNAYAILAGLALHEGDGVEFVRQFLHAIKVDPKDHELPGIVAGLLYELELVEEGDDFRNRVLATAPTSPVAYRLELLRALAVGDETASVASARRAIEDDIEDRRFSYAGAVQHLLRVAARRGTVAEEFAYLESQAPGILDIDADAVSLKYRAAQYTAFDAWYTTLTREELAQRGQDLLTVAQSFGFELEDDPPTHVAVLVLQGDTEAAVGIALEKVFTESVAIHLGWERQLTLAQYEEFVADPRVRKALDRWEAEENLLRKNVSAFLADVQAST